MTSLYRKMGGCLLVPRRTVKYLTSDSRWRWGPVEGLITLPVAEEGGRRSRGGIRGPHPLVAVTCDQMTLDACEMRRRRLTQPTPGPNAPGHQNCNHGRSPSEEAPAGGGGRRSINAVRTDSDEWQLLVNKSDYDEGQERAPRGRVYRGQQRTCGFHRERERERGGGPSSDHKRTVEFHVRRSALLHADGLRVRYPFSAPANEMTKIGMRC
ncbi:hypothetical protein B296_00043367 [Ensete ventricosum]|uniref:Uncharacterized protein n=1 Tax=Ensete ventricosum TaxID=4639 RepID=A0A426Y6N0_ENSVE|nr:hypothetical protein B296_00043367 [Ensete ventricosum]